MEHVTWEPIYQTICDDFGYDPAADARVADDLAERLVPGVSERLSFDGASVAVVVGARLDGTAIERVSGADRIVATADAIDRLSIAGCEPSLVVTDLDSVPARVCARTRSGRLVAVHAHGDNGAAIARWLPRMATGNVIGTTQTTPVSPLLNVGGFTDGDRAAFLADWLGASSLSLVGWDLGDDSVSPTKARKLAWAARLLTWLEDQRGERYEALDGHRGALMPG